jgi:uncharacterized membrane protein YbhN (UPF0104 family)
VRGNPFFSMNSVQCKPDTVHDRRRNRRKRVRGIVIPVVSSGLFLLALWILYHEVKNIQVHEMARYFREFSLGRLTLALAASAVSYFALTGYDNLALRHIGHPLGYGRTTFVSYIGYAFSNTIGFSYLSGGFIRYRFYSAWGLSAAEIAKVVAFTIISSFTGFSIVAGICFLVKPESMPSASHLPSHLLSAVGFFFTFLVAAYTAMVFLTGKPLKLGKHFLRLPARTIFPKQILLGVLDWSFAALTLYFLLPPTITIPLLGFISIFMTAQFVGIASFIPGGLGVFEVIVLLLLPSGAVHPQILGSLVMFRVIYYLTHLAIGASMLGVYELLQLGKKA